LEDLKVDGKLLSRLLRYDPAWFVNGRLRLKCDGTRAEARFRLSAKRTSPFKSAGASVQSTTGSRGVRISGSNAGCTMFRGSVRVLATHSIRQFPLHFPPVRLRVPSHFNWTLPELLYVQIGYCIFWKDLLSDHWTDFQSAGIPVCLISWVKGNVSSAASSQIPYRSSPLCFPHCG
jgi:hypothetical protein